MDITFKIDGLCDCGNHVHITATAGGKDYPLTYQKGDFDLTLDDMERGVVILLRSFIKKSGLSFTNLPQMKTAIEAETFKL